MVSCCETSQTTLVLGSIHGFSDISGKVFFNCLSNTDLNVVVIKLHIRFQILCDKLNEGIPTACGPEMMVLFCARVNFHRSTQTPSPVVASPD